MRTKAQRSRHRMARNFGAEAALVRAMPCLVTNKLGCVAAHFVSRGAGGGRFDIFPVLPELHDEQHRVGIKTFADRYGLDMRAECDRVALEHPQPLGIRGLADRFAWWQEHDSLGERGDPGWASKAGPVRLEGYDAAALLSWVRRHMSARLDEWGVTNPTLLELENLAYRVAGALELDADGGEPLGVSWALCKLAGGWT